MFLTAKNKSLDITHLKSVIFDMDGTLIESEHVWAEAKKHIAQIHGQKVSDEELQKFIGRGISDFIDEVFGPTTVFKKEMIKQLPWQIEPYPKGINTRYDAGYKPTTQGTLF